MELSITPVVKTAYIIPLHKGYQIEVTGLRQVVIPARFNQLRTGQDFDELK